MRSFIAALILSVLVVSFALLNDDQVDINLWYIYKIHSTSSLLIVVSIALGAALSLAFSIPAIWKRNAQISKLEKLLKNQKNPPSNL